MSAELLAKLTAQGINITGEGFGGTGGISESDVAGAMAGMRKPVYEYMRLKYVGDLSMLARVVERTVMAILGEAMMGDGRLTVKEIKRLGLLIVTEAVRGPLCENCNGTGITITKDTASDCGRCGGSGKVQATRASLAEFMGVSSNTFRKKYDVALKSHTAELEGMEQEGFAHLRREFARRAEV